MIRRLPSNPTAQNVAAISEWLTHFDNFPLECDGMTRAISTALSRDGVGHKVYAGYLSDNNDGRGITHYWISLNDDFILDLRARMWLGEQAPHGVFLNGNTTVTYRVSQEIEGFILDPALFHILTGASLDEVLPFPASTLESSPLPKKIEGLLLDETGNPLRVFRGEHGMLEGNIDRLQTAMGTYSFSSCAVANAYAMSANDKTLWDENAQPRLIPCYLKLANPVFNSYFDPYVDLNDLISLMGSVAATQLTLRLSSDIEETNAFHELAEDLGVKSLQELINRAPQSMSNLYAHIWRVLDDVEFIKWCKDKGYDGAIFRGSGESLDAIEYRVFDAQQVIYVISQPWNAPDPILSRKHDRSEVEPRLA